MKLEALKPAGEQFDAHLDHDMLDEVLLGIAAPSVSAHLAVCSHCAERLQSFNSTVNLFNQATLAWSEAKSNTLTRDLSEHRPHPVLTLAAARSYIAAILVAVAVMLTAGVRHRTLDLEAANNPIIIADSSFSGGEIAEDNAMLHAIDSELSRPDPLPAVLAGDPQAPVTTHQVSN